MEDVFNKLGSDAVLGVRVFLNRRKEYATVTVEVRPCLHEDI
jgi:hypothetical protein